MIIKSVKPKQIYSLRSLVLRPGKPIKTTFYDKDYEKSTIHFGAFLKSRIISIATFYPETLEGFNNYHSYRLRGMATHPSFQKRGFGQKILEYSFIFLKNINCDLIWCKARIIAVPFYEKLKYKIIGESYQIDDIGEHFTMYKKLS